MPRLKLLPWAAVVTIGLGSTAAQAAFDIRLNLDSVAPGYRSYFEAAESFWEGVITGYQPGIALSGLNIRAATFNGSPGGTLGFAGWTDGIRSQGYALATDGTMSFDLADVPGLVQNGQFAAVIQHEMAHVLGFGTLWTSNYNGVYQDGTGRYTGPAALAEYRREFSQPGAQWVPVELGGGAGTANGHWNEVDGGSGPTGFTDGSGRNMRNELMTGWLNGPTFVSRTTVASFQDIGYTVNLRALAGVVPAPAALAMAGVVPEPATLALWLMGLPLLVGVAAQRRQRA